jgi:hypothetical protein
LEAARELAMARRSAAQTPQALQLSHGQVRPATNHFKNLISDLNEFDLQSVQVRSDPRIQVLEVSIKDALIETFGHLLAFVVRQAGQRTHRNQ